MRSLRPPPQILRLVVLAVGVVATYAVARHFLTPRSFGEYGHYRGAALGEIASHRPEFAGATACAECHATVAKTLAEHEHRGISCESCHGPGREHDLNPHFQLVKLTDATCLRCHAANPARPAWLKQINVANHYGDGCTGCHFPHHPNDSP